MMKDKLDEAQFEARTGLELAQAAMAEAVQVLAKAEKFKAAVDAVVEAYANAPKPEAFQETLGSSLQLGEEMSQEGANAIEDLIYGFSRMRNGKLLLLDAMEDLEDMEAAKNR